MRLRRRSTALVAAALALSAAAAAAFAPAASAASPTLRAGAGRADITPRLGYYLGGWTRADRVAQGQHTRLFARAMVLRRGDRKVALVAVDLFMIPAGMVFHIGQRLADRGLSEQNILISASHTHSGPGGFANYPSLNTAAPSLQTITDPFSYVRLLNPAPADPELYTFLTDRIATAIRRADDDLAPAEAGWASTRIIGLTRNRSLEAHLNNHGIVRARGEGREEEDPAGGYLHTIDPAVDVLRVDQLIRRRGRRSPRRVPIGAWSTFADHGTVTKSSFQYYNADHHASATRIFEQRVRRAGRVPRSQEVANVYGNSNEGDMSAGLDRHGPAASDYVGRVEAAAMLRAWRSARRSLSRRPALDVRWTRMCFCGQETEGGQVSDHSEVGLPFLTGSEEERGPLYDVIGVHFEDTRNPVGTGPHGMKYSAPAGDIPNRVPLLAVRVGRRLIVSVPGEGTKEVGARIRAAVSAAVAGSSIRDVVISGLANEFVLYFTTPEEYDRQHYEGGNTHFGRVSSNLLKEETARLARTLARGEPAPPPVEFDSTNGVTPTGPPYGDGAASGSILAEPSDVARLQRATLRWQGGPQGLDRPVDRAFVTAQRRARGGWVHADDDLGLAMLWRVDADGVHRAWWEVSREMPAGIYRLVVTAKRYRLQSRPFEVRDARSLTLVPVPADPGHVAISLQYPPAQRDVDLTHRPATAPLGRVRFTIGGRSVTVRARGRRIAAVRAPTGAPVVVEAGDARDVWGNGTGRAVTLR